MTAEQFHKEMSKLQYLNDYIDEILVANAGMPNEYHVFFKGKRGIALADATPEQVLEFMKTLPTN